jgi:hypothetical protein
MSSSPLNQITRRAEEDEYDEIRTRKELEREDEIEKLDDAGNTEKSDEENNLPKTCLNCQNKGYKHLNRHFCNQACATSYYWMQPNKNPYKPKGGKTKKRRTKKTKRRKGKVIKSKRKNIQ